MIVNRGQLSDIFGVAKTTVDVWVKRGCPIRSKGGRGVANEYDTVEVYRWLSSGNDDLDINKERAKLLNHQAAKTELQVEEMKRNLIPAEDVTRTWQGLVAAMRAKLLSVPVKAAPLLVPLDDQNEIKTLLKDYVYDALAELHTELSGLIARKPDSDN